MEADYPFPDVPLSYPNIMPELVPQIRAAAAEQSYDISCSVVPPTWNSPSPVFQAAENLPSVVPSFLPSVAGGALRESDKSAECLHWTEFIHNLEKNAAIRRNPSLMCSSEVA